MGLIMITVTQIHEANGRIHWTVSGADLRTQGQLLALLQGSRMHGIDCVTHIGRRAMGAAKDETAASVAARVRALAESLARA